jgi:hypothetical protein
MRSFVLTLLLPWCLQAQNDTTMLVPLLGVHFGVQLPGMDLVARFGPNLTAGGQFCVKTRSNWFFGIESNYIFGSNVKEDVLKQMRTSGGFVIDNQGFPADLRVTERGLSAYLLGGRLFKVGANPNSGILLLIGCGYMQHRINLYDAQQRIAAMQGKLVYGYDRLTAGVALTQFIGYFYLSENRLANFYAGFDFHEGFTSSLRKFNYDTGMPDTKSRMDILTGIRAGWILPLYRKTPNDFYYN